MIRYLEEKNKNFASNPYFDQERMDFANKQSPYTVVVSCSDSRVVVPFIFDTYRLGQFFEIKTAGQALGKEDIESIRYAVEHLHSKLVIVLGHTNCGAVTATIDSIESPEIRKEYPAIVKSILPPVTNVIKSRKIRNKEELLHYSVIENAIDKANLVAYLMNLEYGKEVVPAVYDTVSGKVTFYA